MLRIQECGFTMWHQRDAQNIRKGVVVEKISLEEGS